MKDTTVTIILVLSALLSASCDILEPQAVDAPASILYTVAGGFEGGLHTKLSISPTGFTRLESTYPVLERQLSEQEQGMLLEAFRGFKELREEFPDVCRDDFIYTIERVGEDYSKRVVISGCAMAQLKDSDPSAKKIHGIVTLLAALAKNMYDTQAPWIGLTANFSIDAEVYGLGEPITLTYRVFNHTNKERGLYFKNQQQFSFWVYKPNIPSFHYFFPNLRAPDSTPPSQIILQPGETKELLYRWDQTVTTPTGAASKLAVGSYRIVLRMLAGDLPSHVFSFDVVDRAIPIGGDIIPDWSGEDLSSHSYSFMLSIFNWTSSRIVLHFPNSQRIFVRLYDLDRPEPGQLIYEGPLERDSQATQVALEPGQTKVFSHVVSKSSISKGSYWTFAKVTLLCSDFEFSSEAQLRIFR